MNNNGNLLRRMRNATVAAVAFASVCIGTAHASDPVINATGTGKANCTAVVKFSLHNTGSGVAAFEEHIGKQVIPVSLAPDTSYVHYEHGRNGQHWSLWGPADVRLAHGTIPAQCPGGSPHAFISVSSDCVAKIYLDTHDRVKGPAGDVSFYVTPGSHPNVIVHHQRTAQPPLLLTRQLAPRQVAKVEVLGHVADRVQAPDVCIPTP